MQKVSIYTIFFATGFMLETFLLIRYKTTGEAVHQHKSNPSVKKIISKYNQYNRYI